MSEKKLKTENLDKVTGGRELGDRNWTSFGEVVHNHKLNEELIVHGSSSIKVKIIQRGVACTNSIIGRLYFAIYKLKFISCEWNPGKYPPGTEMWVAETDFDDISDVTTFTGCTITPIEG